MLRLLLILFCTHLYADDQLSHFRIKRYFVQRAQAMQMEMGERFPDELRPYIGFQFIQISNDNLIDNRGSQVDAIGVPGLVTLKADTWLSFIESDINLDLLILHELYRMAGINDDSYRLSLPLYRDFYTSEETSNLYCDLNETLFENYYQTRDYRVTGRASLGSSGGVLIINTMNRQGPHQAVYDNARAQAETKCREEGYPDGFQIIETGGIRMERSYSNGFRREGAQMRIKVRCQRLSQRRLSRGSRRELLCEKVENCRNLLDRFGAHKQIEKLENDHQRCF